MEEFKVIKVRHGDEVWAAVGDTLSGDVVLGPFKEYYVASHLVSALNAALMAKRDRELAELPVA